MPPPSILSLSHFRSSFLGWFSEGSWALEYHDRTHVPGDAYVSLGQMDVIEKTPKGDAFFRFRAKSQEYFERNQDAGQDPNTPIGEQLSIREVWERENVGSANERGKQARYAGRFIIDQLSECLVRLGLLRPEFELDQPESVGGRKFATVVMDTNALRDGAIRHLREQYPYMQLWAIIPIVSLMEIGEKVAYMTSKDKDGCKPQHCALIRHRPQVTVTPVEVGWIRDNFPTETLELAPELMRSFRGYEIHRDPDRISSNDRLILEGIKDLRRQRGLQEGIFLMSADKDMSRMARVEGLHTIYPVVPDIQSFPEGVYSIRYSLEAKKFVICSAHSLLWDLTHVFGKIRARCYTGRDAGRAIGLHYYYPTKQVNEWVDDRLEVTEFGPGPPADAI
jgi:hypothetical protein